MSTDCRPAACVTATRERAALAGMALACVCPENARSALQWFQAKVSSSMSGKTGRGSCAWLCGGLRNQVCSTHADHHVPWLPELRGWGPPHAGMNGGATPARPGCWLHMPCCMHLVGAGRCTIRGGWAGPRQAMPCCMLDAWAQRAATHNNAGCDTFGHENAVRASWQGLHICSSARETRAKPGSRSSLRGRLP
jgi:hypothetical protein